MAFRKVCKLDDLWEGEMAPFDVDGHEVLIIHHNGGELCAFQGICPHQEMPLSEGTLSGNVLTCFAHLWEFDARTGQGINPGECQLARYPVRVESGTVEIDIDGVRPSHAIG